MSIYLEIKAPEHWQRCRLQTLFRMYGGGTPTKDNLDYWGGDIPWVSPKDMKTDYVEATEDSITKQGLSASATRLVPAGCILIVVRSGILKHSIPTALAGRSVALNQDMKALVPVDAVDARFIRYLIAGHEDLLLGAWRSLGATVESLDSERIKQSIVPIPPRPFQQAIADYLDEKTADLDVLIEKKRKLLDLLAEEGVALINQAVTKGLDASGPMKDSGIPWIGQIPAHWAVKRLKHLVAESISGPYGSSLTKSMYALSGYRVYGQQQVIRDDFSFGDYYISPGKYDEMSRYRVFPGDVLISVMGTVGRVAVVPDDAEPGIINPRLVRYRPRSEMISARFMQMALLSESCQAQLKETAQGSTMDGLNMSILGDLRLVLPPLMEQAEIVRDLTNKISGFDQVRQAIESQANRLQEYRQALITAAVTGQLDIGAAA